MPSIQSITPFSIEEPYRKSSARRESQKIIFLALEGSVTEEEYFKYIRNIFSDVKSKIHLLSVTADIATIKSKKRTANQNRILSMGKPLNLVERLDSFKRDEESVYKFSEHPEDEFWIVADVDDNWEPYQIDKWNKAISACMEKQYNYAISNPQFEAWLLLHFDNPSDEDKSFAVTDTHSYERTNHFRERLNELNVPLRNGKHIRPENFNISNIRDAVKRAKELHIDRNDRCPHYYATTVYLLIEKILELLPEQPQTGGDTHGPTEEAARPRR